MIKSIVCVDSHFGIGKKGGLLYHFKKDMEFFKANTIHHVVAMGENTLLSFPGGKALKNRTNIVLCPEGHEYPDCICVHTFDAMLKTLRLLSPEIDVYVIGGAMFYKSMLPYCDELLVTKVDAFDPEATAFYPNIDEMANFRVVSVSGKLEESGKTFSMVDYVNDDVKKD